MRYRDFILEAGFDTQAHANPRKPPEVLPSFPGAKDPSSWNKIKKYLKWLENEYSDVYKRVIKVLPKNIEKDMIEEIIVGNDIRYKVILPDEIMSALDYSHTHAELSSPKTITQIQQTIFKDIVRFANVQYFQLLNPTIKQTARYEERPVRIIKHETRSGGFGSDEKFARRLADTGSDKWKMFYQYVEIEYETSWRKHTFKGEIEEVLKQLHVHAVKEKDKGLILRIEKIQSKISMLKGQYRIIEPKLKIAGEKSLIKWALALPKWLGKHAAHVGALGGAAAAIYASFWIASAKIGVFYQLHDHRTSGKQDTIRANATASLIDAAIIAMSLAVLANTAACAMFYQHAKLNIVRKRLPRPGSVVPSPKVACKRSPKCRAIVALLNDLGIKIFAGAGIGIGAGAIAGVITILPWDFIEKYQDKVIEIQKQMQQFEREEGIAPPIRLDMDEIKESSRSAIEEGFRQMASLDESGRFYETYPEIAQGTEQYLIDLGYTEEDFDNIEVIFNSEALQSQLAKLSDDDINTLMSKIESV